MKKYITDAYRQYIIKHADDTLTVDYGLLSISPKAALNRQDVIFARIKPGISLDRFNGELLLGKVKGVKLYLIRKAIWDRRNNPDLLKRLFYSIDNFYFDKIEEVPYDEAIELINEVNDIN